MTREEAIKRLKEVRNTIQPFLYVDETIDYAIQALEQEPILDKIRAEIEGKYRIILKDTPEDNWAVRWNDCLDEVIEVINKYRTEERG